MIPTVYAVYVIITLQLLTFFHLYSTISYKPNSKCFIAISLLIILFCFIDLVSFKEIKSTKKVKFMENHV